MGGCITKNNYDDHYKYPIDDISIKGNNIKWKKKGALIGWGMSSNVFVCESHNGNKACMKIFKRSIRDPNLFYLQSGKNDLLYKKDKLEIPRRESNNLKRCKHTNIVKWLDYIENTDYIYLIMEHVNGKLLLDFINQNKYDENTIAIIVISIIKAIENMDENGLMHLDLKPENIMINVGNLRVILLDFGTSSNKNHNIDEYRGTLGYTCPEIVIKCDYKNNPDIWSIGCILYMLIEKKLPYKDDAYCLDKFDDLVFSSKWGIYDVELKNMCEYMLQFNDRPSIKDCIEHSWFTKNLYLYNSNIENIDLRVF